MNDIIRTVIISNELCNGSKTFFFSDSQVTPNCPQIFFVCGKEDRAIGKKFYSKNLLTSCLFHDQKAS